MGHSLPLDATDEQVAQRERKKAFLHLEAQNIAASSCGYYDAPTLPSKKKDHEKVVSLVTKDLEAVENASYLPAPVY